MARIRSIKPEFPSSETLGRVSRDARLLFVLLWTICDDSGRSRAAPRYLVGALFPFDDDALDHLDAWLGELESVGAIRRYTVAGAQYLDVPGFSTHQKIDRPSAPKWPPFEANSRGTREGLATGSRGFASSSPPDGMGGEGKGVETPYSPPSQKFDEPSRGPREKNNAPGKRAPAPRSGSLTDPEGFAEFWTAYPNKSGKVAARKAWSKLSPSPELRIAILASVRVACASDQWTRDGGKYIPHASTWLNGRRFEDEVTAPSARPSAANNWLCPPDVYPLDLPADDPRRLAYSARGV